MRRVVIVKSSIAQIMSKCLFFAVGIPRNLGMRVQGKTYEHSGR